MRRKKIVRIIDFTLRLTVILLILLIVQFGIYFWLGIGSFRASILKAYAFNLTFAIVFFVLVELFENKVLPHLGNAFLGFSLIKFMFFLFFLYSDFKTASGLKSAQFFAFFAPYSVCLFYETRAVIKRLNA